ncbi:hypothetical protein [Jeotgalibacillus terrae]|uniref:Uncharacterized protein n=1 Tax=Jeotgalibacillus terrae TaxID=587735 RepID=A0ABW5ZGZ3_9BACL|nr:hypothetical protein [Jeotgalibacillus terrae]MBM7579431.1 tellurite resistance protein TehA-like permease [Jeotgalibacillus terrae]
MSPKRLIVMWIIPNILSYIAFTAALIFVLWNSEKIREAGQMGVWVLTLFALLIVAVLGSKRIKYWLKQE